jgi:hypothetical protein
MQAAIAQDAACRQVLVEIAQFAKSISREMAIDRDP